MGCWRSRRYFILLLFAQRAPGFFALRGKNRGPSGRTAKESTLLPPENRRWFTPIYAK
jgi:hypothetical protein